MAKILIVEDEQTLAKALKEKFDRFGFETKIVADGESATPMIQEYSPNLIILDLILPKKSGFEVLEALKADEKLKRIPVVVVSNLGEDENIKKAFAMGATDYYVKSQHPLNEIAKKVKKILVPQK